MTKSINLKRDAFRAFVAGTIALAIWAAAPLAAHHSFAATYFEDQTIEITGTLLQFQFRNPHSFVHIQAPDSTGEMQRWAVEWGGAGQLGQQGVTSTTLRAGDEVTIVGNPGRVASDYRVRMPKRGVRLLLHAIIRNDLAKHIATLTERWR